jgi:hypothetical protein
MYQHSPIIMNVNSFCGNWPGQAYWSTPIGSSPPSTGNSRECRFYHAQVGVATNNSNHCNYATPLSVIGTCVTSDSLYISDGNSATATYCDNHIRICGLVNVTSNPIHGMLDI